MCSNILLTKPYVQDDCNYPHRLMTKKKSKSGECDFLSAAWQHDSSLAIFPKGRFRTLSLFRHSSCTGKQIYTISTQEFKSSTNKFQAAYALQEQVCLRKLKPAFLFWSCWNCGLPMTKMFHNRFPLAVTSLEILVDLALTRFLQQSTN